MGFQLESSCDISINKFLKIQSFFYWDDHQLTTQLLNLTV